jgi:hypothetical protein
LDDVNLPCPDEFGVQRSNEVGLPVIKHIMVVRCFCFNSC